jgi:hypothetical protein
MDFFYGVVLFVFVCLLSSIANDLHRVAKALEACNKVQNRQTPP